MSRKTNEPGPLSWFSAIRWHQSSARRLAGHANEAGTCVCLPFICHVCRRRCIWAPINV